MNSSNKLIPILLAVIALVAGVLLSLNINKSPDVQLTKPDISGLLWPNPKQISPFELTDQNGQKFDLENLKDKWSMMFFGYTNCPDVCPTTMTLLNSIVKELEEDQKSLPQVIFVTVDPERDTQQLLSYVSYFNTSFLGLSGSEEELSLLTKQLGILYMKIPNENASGSTNYLMDHSSSILLFDPKARLVGIFSTPHEKEDIKQRYLKITQFVDQINQQQEEEEE